MRKVLLAAAALVLTATASFAWEAGSMMVGFVDSDAPIGGRYCVNDKVAIDAGIGFRDVEDAGSSFTLAAGVPFCVHQGDKAHLLLRPGLAFESTSIDNAPAGVDDSDSQVYISGLLVVEFELSESFAVSGAHGLVIGGDPQVMSLAGWDWTGAGFMYKLK